MRLYQDESDRDQTTVGTRPDTGTARQMPMPRPRAWLSNGGKRGGARKRISMDGGQNSLTTLFFLVAAVLVFLKLRSVLGRRTGDEPARFERYRADRAAAEAQAAAKAEN